MSTEHRLPLDVIDNRHLNSCAEAELRCRCGEWVPLPLPDIPSFCVACRTLWVAEPI